MNHKKNTTTTEGIISQGLLAQFVRDQAACGVVEPYEITRREWKSQRGFDSVHKKIKSLLLGHAIVQAGSLVPALLSDGQVVVQMQDWPPFPLVNGDRKIKIMP